MKCVTKKKSKSEWNEKMEVRSSAGALCIRKIWVGIFVEIALYTFPMSMSMG